MDYLTRLIARAGTSSSKQKPNTPAERLASCQKICNSLQYLWRNVNFGPDEESNSIQAAKLLTKLNALLHDESRQAAPHSCLLYVASSQIYIIVVKIALGAQDVEVTRATGQLFHVLVEGEAEGLLDSKLFSRSLLDFVRYTLVGPRMSVDEQTESELIELLFEVASKIRIDPDLLPAWFYPERDRSVPRHASGDSRRNQFPLFYVLVQYVHHEGPVGDFSRTALLYLTETASKSKSLETWMIESDLAPQMAGGLGALYSGLSRHFPPLGEKEKALPIIALSDSTTLLDQRTQAVTDYEHNVKVFLTYLAFWQDTLNHCRSLEVTETLLDHFQVLFIQQLLYPSLLESSDVAGGSTAAVLAHLVQILHAIDHAQLVRGMLRYLLASKGDKTTKEQSSRRPRLSVSRRKSIDHLALLAEAAQAPSSELFTLLDLMIMSLRSRYSHTVNACLKLTSIIIEKHHCYVATTLYQTEIATTAKGDREVQNMNKQLMELFDYAGVMGSPDTMDESYQATLIDAKMLISRHSCSSKTSDATESLAGQRVRVAPDCKLFEATLDLLQGFFANDTLTNLYLTEVIVSLAACEHFDIRGWLIASASDGRAATTGTRGVWTILKTLTEQVQQWRNQFKNWETLIAMRRSDLDEQQQLNLDGAQNIPSKRKSVDGAQGSPPASPSGSRPSSRPATPRGRKISNVGFGSIDGTLSSSPTSRSFFNRRNVASSPLRQTLNPEDDGNSAEAPNSSSGSFATLTNILQTQVIVQKVNRSENNTPIPFTLSTTQLETPRATTPSLVNDSGAVTPNVSELSQPRSEVSLNHILTNAIILQEFILEVAAIVQIRASLFDEVDMD